MFKIKKRIENYLEKIPYYNKIIENFSIIIFYLIIVTICLLIFILFPISILGFVLFPLIILRPKITHLMDRILNFKGFEEEIDVNNRVTKDKISTFLQLILQNTFKWIESFELQMNLFIRSKRNKRSILLKILLYISVLILSIMMTSFAYLNLDSSWYVIIHIFNYIFLLPLLSLDINVNKPKILYRYSKKTLNYIKRRIYLIFQNHKIKNTLDDVEQVEKILYDLTKRIENFNKLFKPTSNYLREFEVIGIIGLIVGVFLNPFIITNIDFHIFSLLLISLIPFPLIFYLFYLLLHHKINSVIIKSEINKRIESLLDKLTSFIT